MHAVLYTEALRHKLQYSPTGWDSTGQGWSAIRSRVVTSKGKGCASMEDPPDLQTHTYHWTGLLAVPGHPWKLQDFLLLTHRGPLPHPFVSPQPPPKLLPLPEEGQSIVLRPKLFLTADPQTQCLAALSSVHTQVAFSISSRGCKAWSLRPCTSMGHPCFPEVGCPLLDRVQHCLPNLEE